MKTTFLKVIPKALHGFNLPGKGRWRMTVMSALAILSGICFSQPAGAQSYSLTNVWFATNTIGHLANNSGNRGVAYSVVSNEVFVATRSTGTTGFIDVFDGTAGTLLSGAGGIAGANLGIDQVGVGDDGTLYGAPLQTAVSGTAGSVTVYSWTNWFANSTPHAAYGSASGDPLVSNFTGKRIGDSMAVSGSGVNTLILLGVGPGCTNFVLLHTTDGVNFTATAIFVPTGLPGTGSTGGGNVLGITLYTNNSFLVVPGANNANPSVYLVSYPANFASQSTVTGTVLGNMTALAGVNYTEAINYAPQANLLGVAQTASLPTPPNVVGVFGTTNFPGSLRTLATNTVPTPNSNGNSTGGVALGGAGKTNFLYVLESNNGLRAYAIAVATVPVIGTAPVGINGVFPTYNLSVVASGATPLAYQWLASNSGTNISSTFTNIPNATNASYAVNYATTNYFEVLLANSFGSITSAPVRVALLKPVTSTVVTQLWQVSGGTYAYLPASGDQPRGLGYDTNSQRLVVASIVGGTGLYILDANTGTNIGTLSASGVSGGTFAVDQVGIGDDGVVYVGNLPSGSPGTGFNLYSWPAPTNGATGTQAFVDTGSLGGGDRWGDTMAVRGGGLNTQILLGSHTGTNVAFLNNSSGGFTGAYIPITNAPAGFAANGITFGAGNTLWAKSYLGHLYEIAFDPVNLVGGVITDYPNPSKIPSTQVGVGIDPVNNIMAGIDLADVPNDVKLYQLTGTSDAPVLFDQSFFASANGNGNANAAIAMKYPRLFALDVNNGLVGLTYGTPPTTLPTVGAVASQTVYTNIPAVSFSASVSGSLPLYYQWQFSLTTNNAGFANVAAGTNSTYTLNYPPLSAAGYYRVVVHNIAGFATSSPPALLTLIIPTTSLVVTQLWTLPAGSLAFLDGSSYNTRGLAYDTNSGTVLVADNSNIHLLNAANGSYLGDLNVAGAYSGGYNNWLFDQIGVADDGTLYAANLTLSGPNFVILSWAPGYGPGSVGTAFVYGGSGATATGADPGNGSGDRWGDTMDVRGSGTNTEILIGSYTGTNVVLFTTPDGQNFNANLIAITNVPAGFSGQGIAFGPGNTFFTKSPGYLLRQVTYDLANLVGGATRVYTTMPSAFDGIGVDVTASVLGGVNYSDTPNDLQLYLLSGNANGPSLFDQAFFGSVNINSQFNAATTLKGGKGFSLDANNGVTAVTYGVPSAPAVTITSVAYAPGNTVITWNNTFDNHSYQVQFKTHLLDPTWTNLVPSVTTTNATASYTDTTAAGGTRFYRVVSQ